MNLKSAFALLAAGTFLVACGADEVVNINDEAKDKASITLKVIDNHDGSAIEGASVLSIVDNKSKTSDKNGLVVWKSQVLGDHAFQVSKDGYATILVEENLAEQGQGNVARVGDAIANVKMYKAGVTAKGTVLYTDDKNNKVAAEGVIVYASLPSKFVPSELTEKTDKNGVYKFENLPEGVKIDISVGQKEFDGKKYADLQGPSSIGGEAVRAGDVINVALMDMKKVAGELVLVSSNLDKIDTNSSITLTFSAELIADSVKASKWSVETVGGKDQMVAVSLGSDKKSVTIKLVGGTWTKGSSYEIRGTAYSKEGASEDVKKTFSVGGSGSSAVPGNVTKLKAVADEDYPDNYITITWTSPKEAVSGYVLWYKTDKMSAYEEFDDYYYDISTLKSTISNLSISRLGAGAKTVTFKLIPYNANGSADVTKAEEAKYTIPQPAED
jgi:hypothetical protein